MHPTSLRQNGTTSIKIFRECLPLVEGSAWLGPILPGGSGHKGRTGSESVTCRTMILMSVPQSRIKHPGFQAADEVVLLRFAESRHVLAVPQGSKYRGRAIENPALFTEDSFALYMWCGHGCVLEIPPIFHLYLPTAAFL